MKKNLLGMVIDLIENQIYDYNEMAKSYLLRRYNIFFSDGSVLSLWEQGDTCPSGNDECTYGYWAWHEDININFNWQMQPIEVNVLESLREDKEAVKIVLDNGDLVASADKYGSDEYYPSGFAQVGFEVRKPKELAWFIVDLETFDEQDRSVDGPDSYDLSLVRQLTEDEDVISFEGQDVAAISQIVAILGTEADFKQVETILGSNVHLIEVKCINQTLVFD